MIFLFSALVAGVAAPAAAQGSRRSLPVPSDAMRIPCCQCLDGSGQVIDINTRAAPWWVARAGFNPFQQVVSADNPAWAPVAPAGWVGPPGAPTAADTYNYRLRFFVSPNCAIPMRITVSGRFAADNRARVILTGSQIAVSQGPLNSGFLASSITQFAGSTTGPGLHWLMVSVDNTGGSIPNYTGMILQGAITVRCPWQAADGTIQWDRPRPQPPFEISPVDP